jgi:hypothetical protein
MDNNTFRNFPATIEIVGGTIEVTGHLDGRSLINGLWRTLSTSNLAQDADNFMDQSRGLLQRHLRLMPLRDQNIIRESLDLLVSGIHIAQSMVKIKWYNRARERRDNMENQSGISQLRKNLAAREYKRRARKTYKLVKVIFYRNDT